ncbi:MAG: GNAT family N-acetyltransferase [Actinomycetota bacterium]
MSDILKIRYEIDLSKDRAVVEIDDVEIRRIAVTDRDRLAQLMLDAYIGTIDYEGETLVEAIDEVDAWLDGTPMLDHSFCAVVGDDLVSAVLVSFLEFDPLIRSVMTHPEYKGSRLARAVTDAALATLSQTGHSRVVLYITQGNTASERLFDALGAQATPIRPHT